MSSRTDKNKEEPAARKSFPIGYSSLSALLMLALIALWMLSGDVVIGGSDTDKVPPIAPATPTKDAKASKLAAPKKIAALDKKLFKVRAKLFTSKPRKEVLHVRARSEADIRVKIRAETSGRVESISGKKGQLIKRGSVLCKLDLGARRATLAQAEALVAQTKSDYRASTKLAKRGFSAKLNVNAKKAAYDGAVASVKKARIDLDNTSIRAPFTGIIEDRPARVGDYLKVSSTCVRLVKLNPLLIVGDVSERNITKLRVGQTGRAELVTGEKVTGKIRYISPSAKIETRTFRVELEVSNKGRRMRDGVTADIFIPLNSTIGHLISPAFLTLSDEGDIGVRTVGKDNMVRFMPVKILEQGKSGVWITGLPTKVTIITVGHDYVIDGQKVDVIMENEKRAARSGDQSNERS